MKKLLLVSSIFLTACATAQIERNNAHLFNLKVGMTRSEVFTIMGEPQRSEGYKWGTVWLYKTKHTPAAFGHGFLVRGAETDDQFTPVAFDDSDKLIGWGRNFYTEWTHKYEVKIEK